MCTLLRALLRRNTAGTPTASSMYHSVPSMYVHSMAGRFSVGEDLDVDLLEHRPGGSGLVEGAAAASLVPQVGKLRRRRQHCCFP